MCNFVQLLSHVQLFGPRGLWPTRLFCPLEFSRQEYWCGLLFPTPGDVNNAGIELLPLVSCALAGKFFTTEAPGKPNLVNAAAKSLQSCPTLCDPVDGSPPGSTVPGILQARTLEWVAISFSNAWKWKVKVKWIDLVKVVKFATTYLLEERLLVQSNDTFLWCSG